MISVEYPRFFPLGDSAVTVEFGDRIGEDLNQLAIGLADHLDQYPFHGYVESVPAYSSTTVFYDAQEVRKAFPNAKTSYDEVITKIAAAIAANTLNAAPISEPIVIEVDFSARSGLDLEYVAMCANMTVDDVIFAFTSKIYRVYMLGFLPGFPYMAEVDERIAVPRKAVPRATVPGGSVAIAGRQAGIYPFDSPGGWQIVGRTDADVFRPDRDAPCLLATGDRVRFVRR